MREKARRVSHKESHRKHRTRSTVFIDSSEDEEVFCLDDWEKWIGSSDSDSETDDDDLEIIELTITLTCLLTVIMYTNIKH